MSTINKWKIIKGKKHVSFYTEINIKIVVYCLV